ncbi:MAG TPA: creatininase family protein [Anaerolineae bacterium]|nr:creatininase family protein [Anaerolineae bacterium]
MNKNTIFRHTEMKRPEFEEFIKHTDYAILPVAAIEQHGPHLPFCCDVIIADYLSERIAEETGALLMATLRYTPSFSLRLYPGTVRVSDATFVETLVDISESMYIHGINTIYIFQSHVGAAAACKEAERKLLLSSQARIVNLVLPGIYEAMAKYCKSKRWHSKYVHAEEFETSCVLALRPELVDMSKAVSEYPEVDPLFGSISIPWSDFCKSGVVGDATVATAEKGKALLEFMVGKSVNLIQQHQKGLKDGRKYP